MTETPQIIVIGAGAAGLLAAGHAAELGARVLLLEKMERPGKKILITGNGHCNLTNSRDTDSFMAQFGPNGRFLGEAFKRFFRDDLLALLTRFGVECMTDPEGRIFPASENARDIVRAFLRYLEAGRANLHLGMPVNCILTKNGRVCGVSTAKGDIPADAVILAAGGSSHPQTGSTGDGFRMAAELGHTIVKLRPGLVPLVRSNIEKTKTWQGAKLRSVRVTAFRCPAKEIDLRLVPNADTGRGLASEKPQPPVIESRTGDLFVVPWGFSGPVTIEMSLAIVEALENGPVSVNIDFVPGKDRAVLLHDLQIAMERRSREPFQYLLRRYMLRMIVRPFLTALNIPMEKLCNQITTEEKDRVLDQLKSLRFDIQGAYSMDAALVTAGGISLQEIDPFTMASRLIEGLYLCGEVMDLDAGTGGYNLQAAFSTGYLAGENAAAYIRDQDST